MSSESSTPASDDQPAPPTDRQLQEALGGQIPAVPVSVVYRLGLLVVTLTMILLPLVYVGLILLAGYGVYYHATEHVTLLDEPGGKVGFATYIAPLIVAVVMVLFMIKPLFAPLPREQRPQRLEPEAEPRLFDFVHRLCRLVGAPLPRAIHVDCEVNASAGLGRGIWAVFSSKLILTIGLPLAAGLDLRQLTGVLAHEFGHFAQRAGMRLTFIIRTVSHWFARVVYERDAWDERLVAWSGELDVRISWVFYLARAGVWITRRVLWLLMVLGQLISCFMLRQMEFDADRYEIQLGGSDAFEATARRLPLLSVASQWAHEDIQSFWSEGRLPDDLPALVLANVKQLPEDAVEQLRVAVDETETGLLDTHPSDADRIRAAHQTPTPGIFTLDAPASALFSNFGATCKAVSEDHYQQDLEIAFEPVALRPSMELVRRQEARADEFKAQARFFQGIISPLRPLPLPEGEPAAGSDAAVAAAGDADADLAADEARGLRQQLLDELEPHRERFTRYDELDTRLIELGQATALLDAGFTIEPAEFKLTASTRDAALAARKEAEGTFQALEPQLDPLERLASRRLQVALRLLEQPEIAATADPDGELAREARELLPVARLVGGLVEPLVTLRNTTIALGSLCQQIEGNEESETLWQAIQDQMALALQHLKALLDGLGQTLYPFEHGKGKLTIRTHLAPSMPAPDDLHAVLTNAAEVGGRLETLYGHVLGRLASVAEAAESAAGLDPLPEPPKDEENKEASEDSPLSS